MAIDIENQIRKLIELDDPQALELIYDQIGKKLFGYAVVMLSSRSDAEDAIQELFLKLVEKRDRLRSARNMNGYIFIMLKNIVFEQLRKRQRDKGRLQSFSDYIVPREDRGGAESDEIESLNRALAEIPAEQKEVIVLKFFQDMTFDEIAEATGESINTVASRYRYGMEKMESLLKKD